MFILVYAHLQRFFLISESHASKLQSMMKLTILHENTVKSCTTKNNKTDFYERKNN